MNETNIEGLRVKRMNLFIVQMCSHLVFLYVQIYFLGVITSLIDVTNMMSRL